MKHFVPQNGVYVYERYLNDKNIVVFMNGTGSEAEIDLNRYAETLKGKSSGKDFISGKTVSLHQILKLNPREIMIIE